MTYFNEIDPFCAQWVRNAFEGEVDERDIRTIKRPALAVRQHYFAGIGGWEYALKLAGWPDDQEVWTGSCPCQPFSVAGKQEAHEDERDLWPAFFHLIAIGRPATVIGEQVAGAIAFGWLDRICDDLERIGYAVGAAVLPACGVGAPHIRQRLYWVALRLDHAGRLSDELDRDAGNIRNPQNGTQDEADQRERSRDADRDPSPTDGLADSPDARHSRAGEYGSGSSPLPARPVEYGDDGGVAQSKSQLDRSGQSRTRWRSESPDGGETGGLAFTDREGQGRFWCELPANGNPSSRHDLNGSGEDGGMAHATVRGQRIHRSASRSTGHAQLSLEAVGLGQSNRAGLEGHLRNGNHGSESGRVNSIQAGSAWEASELIYCRDGRWRRVPLEPEFQPLADSGRFGNPRINPDLSSRIGALKGAGNAVVIPLAAEFVKAVMDIVL